MSPTYVVITLLAVVANLAAAWVDFARVGWVVDNMTRYGLPLSWLFWLGTLKTAGALGLLAGFVVPALGVAAAAGLVLYFVGAVAVVVRVRAYRHIVFPAAFLVLAAATLAVSLNAAGLGLS